MKVTIEHEVVGDVVGNKVERHELTPSAEPPRPAPLDGGSMGMDDDLLLTEEVEGEQQPWEAILDQRIAEAEEAQAELARLEALRQKATQAEVLRRQKAELQRATQMEPLADQEEAAIRQALTDHAGRTQEWRAEWEAAYRKLEELANELPALTKEVGALHSRTMQLAATRNTIRRARGIGTQEVDALLGDASGARLWEQVGGMDGGLMPFQSANGKGDKWEKLIMLVAGRPIQVYNTKLGKQLSIRG